MEMDWSANRQSDKYIIIKAAHQGVPSDNHLSRRQPYWQKLCSTHKTKIPRQLSNKQTYEDPSLLVVRKVDYFHHRGSCFYGQHKVFASMVVSSTNGCPMEHPSLQPCHDHCCETFDNSSRVKKLCKFCCLASSFTHLLQ